MRGAKFGLGLGRRDGSDPKDISHICSFELPSRNGRSSVIGDVVAIPLTPEDLLLDQERAVLLMHRAVKVAERSGPPVDVVGLGSLCAVVGRRGVELQERLSIPVTTGGAATAWTVYENALKANQNKECMGILGSASPIGKTLVELLHREGIPLLVDSKKSRKKLQGAIEVQSSEDIARTSKWLIGCGPTGPSFSASILQSGTKVLDVALPHTFSPVEPKRTDVETFFAERMTMPPTWKRGLWGRVYHMVSGYGYNTVLACLVEPAVMAATHRNRPFAQGRRIEPSDVLEFGRTSAELGFSAALSSDFWRGVR